MVCSRLVSAVTLSPRNYMALFECPISGWGWAEVCRVFLVMAGVELGVSTGREARRHIGNDGVETAAMYLACLSG